MVTWTIKDLQAQLGNMSRQKIIETILLPNRHKLDIKTGGFVKYSSGGASDKWLFQASKMSEWINANWSQIMSGGWK